MWELWEDRPGWIELRERSPPAYLATCSRQVAVCFEEHFVKNVFLVTSKISWRMLTKSKNPAINKEQQWKQLTWSTLGTEDIGNIGNIGNSNGNNQHWVWKYWKEQSKQLTWPTLVSGRRGETGGRGRWLRPQSQETPIFQLIFANVFVFVFAFVSVVVFVSPE